MTPSEEREYWTGSKYPFWLRLILSPFLSVLWGLSFGLLWIINDQDLADAFKETSDNLKKRS